MLCLSTNEWPPIYEQKITKIIRNIQIRCNKCLCLSSQSTSSFRCIGSVVPKIIFGLISIVSAMQIVELLRLHWVIFEHEKEWNLLLWDIWSNELKYSFCTAEHFGHFMDQGISIEKYFHGTSRHWFMGPHWRINMFLMNYYNHKRIDSGEGNWVRMFRT